MGAELIKAYPTEHGRGGFFEIDHLSVRAEVMPGEVVISWADSEALVTVAKALDRGILEMELASGFRSGRNFRTRSRHRAVSTMRSDTPPQILRIDAPTKGVSVVWNRTDRLVEGQEISVLAREWQSVAITVESLGSISIGLAVPAIAELLANSDPQ